MRYSLFLLFFALSSSYPLQGMDKLFSKKKSSSDGEITKKQLSTEISHTMEHGFLTAAKENNLKQIQSFLSNPFFNPNIQNECGHTALMMATIHRHKEPIDLLLQDYRVDTTLQDNDGKFAHSYLLINNQKIETIDHNKFFKKFSLDKIVNDYVNRMRKDYISGYITLEVIDIRAQAILKKATASEIEQEDDREMPEESLCKADIEEIKKMILFRLSLPDK